MEIERLELQISDNADVVDASLKALADAMQMVQNAARGGLGLKTASRQLDELSTSINKAVDPGGKLTEIANGLRGIQSVGKINLGTGIKSLQEIPAALNALKSTDMTQFSAGMQQLADSMKPLESIGKTNLTSTINSLNKLPKVTAELKKMDMGDFEAQIKRVTQALKPLADEMQKVANGFSAFPRRIQQFISQSGSVASSNKKVAQSFGVLGTGISKGIVQFGAAYIAIKRIASVMSKWLNLSMDYVENLNLFTVSMGKYAKQALAYAETVQEAVGIDMSEWIRNQGVFKQIASGFGVVEDKAYTMSKALTQLGYDLASYFNIDTESAMEKLQSGIAGQSRPLRELGYAIEQATIQELALELGIEKSVTAMSQAEKSQLRFIAIMRQSTNVMGDMGRTLITPANATRILQQQVTQLGRALGDLLIPFLMKVIPYIQAFVKVITMAIRSLATLVGFELPTIDYSGLDGFSAGVEDVTNGLDDATDAAKKLKNVVSGIDELNIISPDTGDSGGAAAGLNPDDLGLDLDAFDYDFLAGLDRQSQEIFDSVMRAMKPFLDGIEDAWGFIQRILKALEPFKPLLKGIAAGFLAAFGLKWLFGVIKKLLGVAGLGALAGAITAVKVAIVTAATVFALSHNPFLALAAAVTSLWASFKAFLTGLSPLAKTIVLIVAVVAEFVTIYDAVKQLTLGNIDLGTAFLNIVPITAIVGTALYAMLGPIGLVITAVTGIIAAIMGFNKAQRELQEQFINEAFFDGVGISIDSLTAALDSANQEISVMSSKVLELGEDILDTDSMVITANSTWGLFRSELAETGQLTAAHAESMKQSVAGLTDAIRQNLEIDTGIIFAAFSTSAQEAAKDLGFSVSEMTTILEDFQRRFGENVSSVQNDINSLLDRAATVGLNESEMAKLEEHFSYLSEMGRRTSESQIELEQKLEGIAKIDFQSVESAQEKIAELGEVGQKLLGDLDASHTTALASLDTFKNQLETSYDFGYLSEESYQQGLLVFGNYSKAIAEGYEKDRGAVEQSISAALGAIELSLNKQLDAVAKETPTTFADNWNAAMRAGFAGRGAVNFAGDLPDILRERIEEDIGAPIRESLNEISKSLDIPPNPDLGKNLLEGLAGGIASNTHLGEVAAVQSATSVLDSYQAGLQERSPSKATEQMGVWLNEGVANGLTKSQAIVSSAVGVATQGVLDSLNTAFGISTGFSTKTKAIGETIMNSLGMGFNDKFPTVEKTLKTVCESLLRVFNTAFGISGNTSSKTYSIGTVLIESLAKAITDKASAVKNALKNVLDDLEDMLDDFSRSFNKSISGLSSSINAGSLSGMAALAAPVIEVQGYASGGFVTSGELFVARENGIPEMVGRIGNRTAVANNDQIVSAFEGANQQQNALLQEQNALLRQILAKETGIYVDGKVLGRAAAANMPKSDAARGMSNIAWEMG